MGIIRAPLFKGSPVDLIPTPSKKLHLQLAEGGGRYCQLKLILPYAGLMPFNLPTIAAIPKSNSLIRTTSSKFQMCQLKFGKECRMDEISHQ